MPLLRRRGILPRRGVRRLSILNLAMPDLTAGNRSIDRKHIAEAAGCRFYMTQIRGRCGCHSPQVFLLFLVPPGHAVPIVAGASTEVPAAHGRYAHLSHV